MTNKQSLQNTTNKQRNKQQTKNKVHTTAGKLDLGMGEIRKQQKSDNIQTTKTINGLSGLFWKLNQIYRAIINDQTLSH